MDKYKSMRGWSTPPRDRKDYSKREKLVINRVKEFNTKEAAKAKYTLKRSDEYSQELINVIALVPFTSPTQQTAEMLGVKQRTTRHFAKQAKDMALTPKKEPGKKMVNPPD